MGTHGLSAILAYIDPGTGGILFQLLIAGLLSLIFFFTNTFRRIGFFFARLLGLRASSANEKPQVQPTDPPKQDGT